MDILACFNSGAIIIIVLVSILNYFESMFCFLQEMTNILVDDVIEAQVIAPPKFNYNDTQVLFFTKSCR